MKKGFDMTELVVKNNIDVQIIEHDGKQVVSSRTVADETRKKHKEVLRDIRSLLQDVDVSGDLRRQFIGSSYKSRGKTYGIVPTFV